MEIILDTNSLEQRRIGGSITGIIFVTSAEGFSFPADGWDDFPVPIVGWWLESLTALLRQSVDSADCLFMDGPQFMRIFISETSDRFDVHFAERRAEGDVFFGQQSVATRAFVKTLIHAARKLLQACETNNWQTNDTALLKTNLDELEKVVRSKGMSPD